MTTSFWNTSVMDPETNIIDAYKELALLEDHLTRPDRFCPDCITKHLLKIEALADECLSLSGGERCLSLASSAREWRSRLSMGEPKTSVAKSVRSLRKAELKHKKWVKYGLPVLGGYLLARVLRR